MMIECTGYEFLQKVRQIKSISDVHWFIVSCDGLTWNRCVLTVTTDKEVLEVDIPKYEDSEEIKFMRNVSVALLVNKILELHDVNLTVSYGSDIQKGLDKVFEKAPTSKIVYKD